MFCEAPQKAIGGTTPGITLARRRQGDEYSEKLSDVLLYFVLLYLNAESIAASLMLNVSEKEGHEACGAWYAGLIENVRVFGNWL